MKLTRNIAALLAVACVLFTAAFECSIGKSGESSTSSNTTAANTASTPKPAVKVDLGGDYNATGTNPNGGSEYKADLKVTPRDDVYQFSWVSGKEEYDGVGVLVDDSVAVSYTNGSNGKGCGVVLYTIGPNGNMDGIAGYWGVNKSERETAKRTSGSDLDGNYDVSGTNTEGDKYAGTLNVSPSGAGYDFKWNAGNSFTGFGIRTGDKVAVGFGGKQCAFVSYKIKPDGTLDGKWGGPGLSSFGTEVARKK